MPERNPIRRPPTPVLAFALLWVAIVIALWFFGAKGARENHLFAMTLTAYLACWAPYFALSLGSRREKGMRFVACSGALLLTVAVSEIFVPLGWVDYRRVLGKRVPPWEDTRNLLDRDLIHIRRPHFREQGKTTGGDLCVFYNVPPVAVRPFDVKYDNHGFRNDDDIRRSKCIVIGDSFVEAGGVSSDSIFTRHMANALKMPVANLGQIYYGPQQELKVLEKYGLRLQPRVCVWVFFEGNDLQDVWRYREMIKQWPDSVAKYSSWKERSFTMNACTTFTTWFNRVPPSSRDDMMGTVSTNEGERPLWFGYAGKKLTVRDVDALKITLATIGEAHALCKQKGIQLVVAFAPTKFRVYADVCHFEEGTPIRHWVVNPMPKLLSDAFQTSNGEITFLDLTTDLKQAAKKGEILYYPDDTHWSPAGHKVVGRAISEFLTSQHGDLLRSESAKPVP